VDGFCYGRASVPGVCPNSYNFVPLRDLGRDPGEPCPLPRRPDRLATILAGTATHRALFLRLPDRMRLFATTTRDFGEPELARVKEHLGQLYLDASSKLAPDDFARDLKKLELVQECGGCHLLSECPGCFRSSTEDVFTRDDRRVLALLQTLEGAVLDIGCGEGGYLGALEPACRSGRVRYLGLDPSVARVELCRSRYPFAAFRAGTLAELRREAGSFEHVLLLRSINHLPDPDLTLARARDLLAPGGTLLIVDNIVFGLVRSGRHARSAEQGPAEFEHFRNESSHEVRVRVEPLGLELLEHCEVGPGSSNQWLLRYRKPRGTP
jgi:hypothetical protein